MVASYATVQQLKDLGIPGAGLSEFTDLQLQGFLDAGATLMNTDLRARYTLPLLSWDVDLVQWNVDISVWLIMKQRGHNPEAGHNDNFRTAYTDATTALREVGKRVRHPNIVDSAKRARSPRVWSRPLRGH